MRKRALTAALIVLPLLALALATRVFAQGPATLIAETRLPLSNDVKFPHIDTAGRTVYVAGNAERAVARLWAKQDSAGAFPNPALMGPAEGDPPYTSAAVFAGPDGAVHYVWTNAAGRQVFIRSKGAADADFGPARLVTGSSPFPVEVEVAANEDGVFVFWREPNQPPKYRRSIDGVNWNVPTGTIGAVNAEPNLDIAAAAGRRLALAFTRGLGDVNQGYVALWNGSAFVIDRIPTVDDRDFADPSVTFLPDGTLAAALRSTANVDGLGAGVYVTDRAPNGVWSAVGRLIRGTTNFVAIDADPLGNVHLAWINAPSGNDLWYTTRRAGTAYSGTPLTADSGPLGLFNVRGAANLSDRSYGHFVTERFQGRVPFINYHLFGLPVNLVSAQGITIEGGAATTNKTAVSVAFAGLQGSPTEVRWSWNTPPTDAASDSGGFKPLTNPLSVPAPALADPNLCTSATLYAQLRAGAAVQTGTVSDTIVLDRAVQAQFSLNNPLMGYGIGYTNQPTATLTIESGDDCSGIATAVVSGPTPGGTSALDVAGKPSVRLSLPLSGAPGAKTFVFTATDTLGNQANVQRTIIYDTTAPTFADAGPAVAPAPRATSSIVDLTLSEFSAADESLLFGIIVTPTLTPAGGGAPVAGAPVVLPFSTLASFGTNPDTGRLSLRASLNLTRSFRAEALTAGTYSFEIRVVDAAGNQSAQATTRAVQIDKITYGVNLPAVRR